MNYPIAFRFKLAALASQLSAKDSAGGELFYVKQKMFKLKEKIEIYRDSSKSVLIGTLQADRVIDFSPLLVLRDAQGAEIGTIKRQGRVSIWKATYDISLAGQPFAQVKELNPWAKLFDALMSEIPILGLFTGYVFHPRYGITAPNGTLLGELEKLAGFFESNYQLSGTELSTLDEVKQSNFQLLMMAAVLRERMRG